ncbi:hypothetical protein AgCh_003714 [Apium graveolens]
MSNFCQLPLLLLLCSVIPFSAAAPLHRGASASHWLPATATWYGSPDGDGSDGGACGYGTMVDVKPYRARVGAVSPILFKGGEGCGACYKVRCLDRSICARRAVTVIITDECPGGYCSGGHTHFDLSGAAFGRLAVSGEHNQLRNRGVIPVTYRRTACKYPGKNIAFKVNEGSTDHWLSLLVEFEDGDGDLGSMHIKQVYCLPANSVSYWLCLLLFLIIKLRKFNIHLDMSLQRLEPRPLMWTGVSSIRSVSLVDRNCKND